MVHLILSLVLRVLLHVHPLSLVYTYSLNTVTALPSILNFEKELKRIDQMKEENQALREQIMSLQEELVQLRNEKRIGKQSVSVQANILPKGEECDYLVVNTK